MKWEGTLEEYVQSIMDGDIKYKASHERLYHAFKWARAKGLLSKIYGMDYIFDEIEKNFLIPASKGYDARKRLLVLVGPPGSGKTSIVRLLKEALIAFSRTDEGAVYKIKNCPLNENPLLALPADIKNEMKDKAELKLNGFLSPLNKQRLIEDYNGDWRKVEVERYYISETERIGIGSFVPSDPYTQEVTDLIGDVDYSTITTYGSVSDPRAYRYDGEFQVANQGLLELHEVFKTRRELMYPFLTLAEDGVYKMTRQSMVFTDQVIVGHSNEEDLKTFVKQSENDALLSRMILIRVPYNLQLAEEINLYHSILNEEDRRRLSYLAIETLAKAVIMSRLDHRNKSEALFDRINDLDQANIFTLNKRDGMFGIEVRIAFQVLERTMSRVGVISAVDLLEELSHLLELDYRLDNVTLHWYKDLIKRAEKDYHLQLHSLLEDYICKQETKRLDRFVYECLYDRQKVKSWLNISEDMFSSLQGLIDEQTDDQLSINLLPKEYQKVFKQKLLEEYVEELYIKGDLREWLQHYFKSRLEQEGVKHTNKLIEDLYHALT
ncbi:hypothetical protein [Alkalibacillus haloalkaliphilus]|uniref:hypothetical protein n=1 Tax=Alkalibacillus haloalkaliphilus TaxID=94136 RepID=UPI002936A0D7|nr:hypothetical protein [Alkalibacillus haloalkaliphilus]MDV2582467.1 hypothetical protein [Alkalibacillus haloalkaliphilus]